jgi:hypothetical protein
MTLFLVFISIGLLTLVVKLCIDLYTTLMVIRKDKVLFYEEHPAKGKYQFIKGLY